MTNDSGNHKRPRRTERLAPFVAGSKTNPIKANAHNQRSGTSRTGRSAALDPDVVVTVTLKGVVAVAVIVSVAGTVQVEPAGAPAQERETVPLIPMPPMVSAYVAVAPAATVAELEPPDAIPRPRPGAAPIPVSDTVCGLLGALSVIVRVPVRVPVAVGVNVTSTVQTYEGSISD